MTSDISPCGKSLIEIRKNKGPNTESCGTLDFTNFQLEDWQFKGTLMQIWKSANVIVFMWKRYFEGFTLKYLLFFKIWTFEVCEKFPYKHSGTIEYVKN